LKIEWFSLSVIVRHIALILMMMIIYDDDEEQDDDDHHHHSIIFKQGEMPYESQQKHP
jgi:hypothetical protein